MKEITFEEISEIAEKKITITIPAMTYVDALKYAKWQGYDIIYCFTRCLIDERIEKFQNTPIGEDEAIYSIYNDIMVNHKKCHYYKLECL